MTTPTTWVGCIPPSAAAAALGVLLGGLTVRATGATRGVITGGLVQAMVAGRPVGYGEVIYLLPGEQLALGHCTRGIRAYVSVADGTDVPPVLGSRATDTLSGIGARPLAAGDVLPLGPASAPVQLPPEGRPVIFGPDHPSTGGYPVVGVLTRGSCDRVAQLRPGQRVRFRTVAK